VEENICQLLYIKGLITRIYREFKKLNSPKINEPIKKWATELNRTFSKEEIQMPKNTLKNAHHLCCYFDEFTLYFICSFLSYNLQHSFSVVYARCFNDNSCGEVPFWSSLFDVLEVSCT
jgi:hypothetical protein